MAVVFAACSPTAAPSTSETTTPASSTIAPFTSASSAVSTSPPNANGDVPPDVTDSLTLNPRAPADTSACLRQRWPDDALDAQMTADILDQRVYDPSAEVGSLSGDFAPWLILMLDDNNPIEPTAAVIADCNDLEPASVSTVITMLIVADFADVSVPQSAIDCVAAAEEDESVDALATCIPQAVVNGMIVADVATRALPLELDEVGTQDLRCLVGSIGDTNLLQTTPTVGVNTVYDGFYDCLFPDAVRWYPDDTVDDFTPETWAALPEGTWQEFALTRCDDIAIDWFMTTVVADLTVDEVVALAGPPTDSGPSSLRYRLGSCSLADNDYLVVEVDEVVVGTRREQT